jgi:hypothetical protein
LRINIVNRRAATGMLVLQIRSVAFSLLKPVFHVGSMVRILAVGFLELSGQFHSFKLQICNKSSLFEFYQDEISNTHHEKTVKISVSSSSDFSRKDEQ